MFVCVSDRKNPKKNLNYSGEEVQKGFNEKIHKKISSVSILNGFIFFVKKKKVGMSFTRKRMSL